MEVRRS